MTHEQERNNRIETMAREFAAKAVTAMFTISRPIGPDSVSPELRKAFNDLGISEAGIEAFFKAKYQESRTGAKAPELGSFIDQAPGTPSKPTVVTFSRRQP